MQGWLVVTETSEEGVLLFRAATPYKHETNAVAAAQNTINTYLRHGFKEIEPGYLTDGRVVHQVRVDSGRLPQWDG